MDQHAISIRQIKAAERKFKEKEPRDLFYRVAMALIDLSVHEKTSVTVAEALAVLLQTWNMGFYRFGKVRFDEQHFFDIDHVVSVHRDAITAYRERAIDDLCDEDVPGIKAAFEDFERVLGPVGAAKSLHLLAPRFFPLWDRMIAKKYRVGLKQKGENAEGYIRFMMISKRQVEEIGGEAAVGRNPLKTIDEFNYCKWTKGWLR